MSAPTPDRAVTRITLGGLLAGIVAVATAIGSAVTGHGGNLTDALTALGGSGLGLGSVWKFVEHRTAVASVIAHLDAGVKRLEDLDPTAAADLAKLKSETVPQLEADLGSALPQVERFVEGKLASLPAAKPAEADIEKLVRAMLGKILAEGLTTSVAAAATPAAATPAAPAPAEAATSAAPATAS